MSDTKHKLLSDLSGNGAEEPQSLQDFGTRSLCIVNERIGGKILAIYDESFGSAGDELRVKTIPVNDMIQVPINRIKVRYF